MLHFLVAQDANEQLSLKTLQQKAQVLPPRSLLEVSKSHNNNYFLPLTPDQARFYQKDPKSFTWRVASE
jgi:hypothetical protein